MAALEVITLGTGSPLPDPSRAGPSTLVLAGDSVMLFDCGRGVLMRAAAVGVGANRLSALFLTHLHSDHLTDLNDVVTTRWVTSFAELPLQVLGPPRTQEVVDGVLAMLGPDVSYRLAHHADLTSAPPVAVSEVTDGVAFENDHVRVIAAPTDHRPVAPTVGYRVESSGRSVVIAGDTLPCPGLDQLCDKADVLVCTVIRADLLRATGVQRLVEVCDYHSTVEQAADTARRAGVGTLVLTHCVPPMAPGEEGTWRQLAATSFQGEIRVASDLDRVVVD